MQLVIIAGGFGKRLRPLTLTRPKALIPLVDRPLVLHILDSLPPSCDEVIIAVNYLFEQVRDFFRGHESRIAVRVVEEPTPLDTGGALKNVERYLRGPFAVYNGDIVAVEIVKGRITRFVEKPARGETASHLVNAGRYVFEPGVFDFIERGRPVSMEREVFPRLIEQGLTPYRFEGWWSDAGTLANYLNAQHLLLAAGRGKIAPEADVTPGSLRPPVYVGAGSFVEGRLGPDVVLGKSCKVGRASVVNATLLEGVSVDDKVEIASSIIGAGAAIGEGAHVRDSILEDGVQVPPHAEVLDDRVAA